MVKSLMWRLPRSNKKDMQCCACAHCHRRKALRQAVSPCDWLCEGGVPIEARVDPKTYDRDLCLAWFHDVPMDLIDWTVKNSDRQDLGEVHVSRHRRACSSRVLNVAERPLMRWNGGGPFAAPLRPWRSIGRAGQSLSARPYLARPQHIQVGE